MSHFHERGQMVTEVFDLGADTQSVTHPLAQDGRGRLPNIEFRIKIAAQSLDVE